ncbi:MAG: NusG domain II-containing protein [Elusimicrobiales bacterium]|nr:NusG domain II-containing protein [Elusimicrobiales bacterium]
MKNSYPETLLTARPQDYLLCCAVLAASLLWLAAPSGAGGAAPAAARLLLAGEALAELPLDRPARRTYALATGPLTVEVVPGRGVHISDTNCPAKTCLHHGWARKTGETIVCLPNKFLIEVAGEDAEYDAVVR